MSLSWLWIETRRRRRKKSRSRSRSRTKSNFPLLRASKWRRIRSPSFEPDSDVINKDYPQKRPPPESLRFAFRTYVSNESSSVNLELLTIPSKEFKFFEQADVNYFTRHHHSKSDSTKFRHITSVYPPVFLGHNPLNPFSSMSRIGNNIYTLFGKLGESLEFWSYSLDPLHTEPKQLASPTCQNRISARSFSLFGKVYLFGGLLPNDDFESQPFGEVYDPNTNLWSHIFRPPNSDPHISSMYVHVFVASLGESNAKFMVSDYNISSNGRGLVYLYDVATQKWMTHLPLPPRDFEPEFVYTSPVINKEDNHLYWIDKRRAFMYALDWEEMNVFSGPIVGMEHVGILSDLKKVHSPLSLLHLWDDYFCLVWLRPSYLYSKTTEHHFTFIKVVKYYDPDSLVAFVVGCFDDLNRHSPDILDAICF